jgi:hypothetical protein
MTTPNLQSCVGKTVSISIPALTEKSIQELKLVALEAAGIWVSGQHITDLILPKLKLSAAAETPVVFVPFSQVLCLIESVPGVSLSEKLLSQE